MAELPEIIILARQMGRDLSGSILKEVELGLNKPLNVSPGEFRENLLERLLVEVRPLGKWLVLEFSPPGPSLMIHPGMGMDLLSLGVKAAKPPQFLFRFDQGRGFSIRFWWFGYLRLARPGREAEVGGGLGPAPLGPGVYPCGPQ